jgi:NADH:ubiquinone oxidoreductase subunit E
MSMPIASNRKDHSGKESGTPGKASVDITICLGSSCFARGNSKNLSLLESYARSQESNVSIHLIGNLCQEQCCEGPNIKIGGTAYHHVTAEKLCELLQQLDGRGHGTP